MEPENDGGFVKESTFPWVDFQVIMSKLRGFVLRVSSGWMVLLF